MPEVVASAAYALNHSSSLHATPFHVSIHAVGDHDHCSLFYLCKAKNAEQLQINKEVINYQWVSKEQLNQEHIPKDVENIGRYAFSICGI